jgi:hypothetical protein
MILKVKSALETRRNIRNISTVLKTLWITDLLRVFWRRGGRGRNR